MKPTRYGIDCGASAVRHHAEIGKIEGDDEIQVWHLLLSVMEFCADRSIDFDKTLAEVREHANGMMD